MDYKFTEVINNFQRFTIKRIDGKSCAVDRKTNIPYFDEKIFNQVLFAHLWVYATKNNRSLNTVDSHITTEEDLKYAFGHEAEEVYNAIMSYCEQSLSSFGRLYRPETLKREVLSICNYKYVESMIDALYKTPNSISYFETWAKYATGHELNNNVHKQPNI